MKSRCILLAMAIAITAFSQVSVQAQPESQRFSNGIYGRRVKQNVETSKNNIESNKELQKETKKRLKWYESPKYEDNSLYTIRPFNFSWSTYGYSHPSWYSWYWGAHSMSYNAWNDWYRFNYWAYDPYFYDFYLPARYGSSWYWGGPYGYYGYYGYYGWNDWYWHSWHWHDWYWHDWHHHGWYGPVYYGGHTISDYRYRRADGDYNIRPNGGYARPSRGPRTAPAGNRLPSGSTVSTHGQRSVASSSTSGGAAPVRINRTTAASVRSTQTAGTATRQTSAASGGTRTVSRSVSTNSSSYSPQRTTERYNSYSSGASTTSYSRSSSSSFGGSRSAGGYSGGGGSYSGGGSSHSGGYSGGGRHR